MKAPAFDYVKPRNLSEVFDLLAQHATHCFEESRLLNGLTTTDIPAVKSHCDDREIRQIDESAGAVCP